MRGWWALIAVLVLVALAASVVGGGQKLDSPLPVLENDGPRGLAVMATWLSKTTVVSKRSTPFAEIDQGVATVVLAAPSASEIAPHEVEVLDRFVREGGTLVYLAPATQPQPALHRWLELGPGDSPVAATTPGLDDPTGTTAIVQWQGSAVTRVHQLRLSADRQLTSQAIDALPVADFGALWFFARGKGEIWVAAGTSLAENARLDQLDNAQFWAALAERGPMEFDEYHHAAASRPQAPRSLWAVSWQFVVVALAFVAANAVRLAPAREPASRTHRAAIEYVQAMASVTRHARVEGELKDVLCHAARLLARERLGVSLTLDWSEASRLVRLRCPPAAPAFDLLPTARTFLEASQAAASFERRLLGLA